MRIEELHWNILKHMQRSPAHLLHAHEAGYASTERQGFGTLVHAVTLGGEFVVWEGKTRQGKAWEEFKTSHEGKTIVNAKDHHKARRVADKLRAHPIAAALLVGETEKNWTCMLHGRWCGGTIDVYNPQTRALVELKTASSVHPERLKKAAQWYGYHGQLAWYRDAVRARGGAVDSAHIVAVETSAPYAVTVLDLTERILLAGEKLNRVWLEQLRVSEDSDEWPEYARGPVEWDVDDDEDGELVFDDDAGEDDVGALSFSASTFLREGKA